MWRFGCFQERPEWFEEMYKVGHNNYKRKCKCCDRFKC